MLIHSFTLFLIPSHTLTSPLAIKVNFKILIYYDIPKHAKDLGVAATLPYKFYHSLLAVPQVLLYYYFATFVYCDITPGTYWPKVTINVMRFANFNTAPTTVLQKRVLAHVSTLNQPASSSINTECLTGSNVGKLQQ